MTCRKGPKASPALDDMPYGTNIKTPDELPDPPRTTWMGYRNKTGPTGTNVNDVAVALLRG